MAGEKENTPQLLEVISRLDRIYGPSPAPPSTDPFELILWVNVAYLADDARRAEAMARLRAAVGTAPHRILEADDAALGDATAFGILPEESARKLRRAARIAIEEFGGDLRPVLDLPVARAKRALRRFPGIAEPGAEGILLQCRRAAFLAPDSNALRVLVRLGLCPAGQRYAATYSAARDLARAQIGDDIDLLLTARRVLRRHGQVTCRNRAPRCNECALRSDCPFPAGAPHPEPDA